MYKAPSADEISQDLRASIRTEMPGTEPAIWPNNLYVVTKAFAQGLRGLYLRLEVQHAKIFTSLAEGNALDRHGADWGVTRAPEQAPDGTVTITATTGTAIPEGTRLLRADGVVYHTTQTVTAAAGVAYAPVAALDPGAIANADPALSLALETPLAGVTAIVVDSAGLVGGMDYENDASYRARILERKRNPPRGGAPSEYVQWARLLPEVTRVFVQRATPAAGSVTLLFMTDDATADGIPSADSVAALLAIIQAQAPSSANAVVLTPTALPVAVTVANLSPDTPRTRAEVRAELSAMFRRRAKPGTAAASFIFSRSWVNHAVSMAAGEDSHTLTAPAADVTCGANVIAVLGALTFT